VPYRPISARADGLLSLLGMKNLGRNPDLLNESVQPVLDAQGWYLRSSAVASRLDFVSAFASENYSAPFLVAADNEWLYVHHAFGQTFTGGGVVTASVQFAIFRSVPGNSLITWKTAEVQAVLVNGGGEAVVEVRDIWIPPGFTLLLSGNDMTVGVTVPTVGALVSRIQV
jgi:hypothetical protein